MKRHKSLSIIIITLIGFQFIAMGQILKAKLSHYSPDDGLTSNSVSDITQDNKGFIWIATWNGLSRFDGYSFVNYATGKTSNVPMLHNRILKLAADVYGNIWMKMYDKRIFVLLRKTDKIVYAFDRIKGGADITARYSAFCAPDGVTYIIGYDRQLYKLKPENKYISCQRMNTQRMDMNDMTFDTTGNPWIASTHGIIKLDKISGKKTGSYFVNENISCISYKNLNIYAGTKSGKLLSIEGGIHEKLIKQLNESDVTSIYRDNYDAFWYTTEKEGVAMYNTKNGLIKKFSQIVSEPELDLRGGLFQETGDVLWARMTHGGFGYYNRKADNFEYFYNSPDNTLNLSNTVTTYISLPEGVIWLSTIRRGLEKLELLKQRIKQDIPDPGSKSYGVNEIRAMLYDKQYNEIWIGNKAGTLFINKNGSIRKFTHDDNGKSFQRIYGLMKDSKGHYWMSTKGNGLYEITRNGEQLHFKHFIHSNSDRYSISSNNVYITEEDTDGHIWIATYGGGVNLLVKTKDGRDIFINSLNNMRTYPKNEYNKVRSIASDKHGTIWAGTSDGILTFKYKNRKISIHKLKYSKEEGCGLGSDDIIQIRRDRNGVMWIATNGGGLSRTNGIDKDGNYIFKTYETKDGLPSDEIRSITFDNNGNVWFTTDQIICAYDIKTHLFTTFSMQDGVGNITCSEGAAITTEDGRMLFGTLNGCYIVNRKNLENQYGSTLKLQITDFYINDKLMTPRLNDTYDYYVPYSKEVELPSRTSVFAFKFASLNYQLQHRVHYQYMLEGYDNGWKNADDSRMVSYSDVPAGTYTFKVKAFLLESPNKYDERTITVVVPPYILASPIALWIYLILTVICITLVAYYQSIRKERFKNMKVLKIGPQEIAFKHQKDYDFVVQQQNWLEEHYNDATMKIDDLVIQSSMSRTSYYYKLKELTGMSPRDFVKDFRIKKSIMYLEHDVCTIAEVAYKSGFNDPVYFTRIFRETMNVTPSKYREMVKNKETSEEMDKKDENNLEN